MPGSAFSSSAEAVLRSRSPPFFSSALVSALAGAVAGALFLAWAQASGVLRRPPAITATASSVTSRLSMCVLLAAARYGARGRLSSAACHQQRCLSSTVLLVGYPVSVNAPVRTELLQADEAGIRRAAGVIPAPRLLALPPQTVYGLGGHGPSQPAPPRLFEGHDRPRRTPPLAHPPPAPPRPAL